APGAEAEGQGGRGLKAGPGCGPRRTGRIGGGEPRGSPPPMRSPSTRRRRRWREASPYLEPARVVAPPAVGAVVPVAPAHPRPLASLVGVVAHRVGLVVIGRAAVVPVVAAAAPLVAVVVPVVAALE